jgi:hypothetical protein
MVDKFQLGDKIRYVCEPLDKPFCLYTEADKLVVNNVYTVCKYKNFQVSVNESFFKFFHPVECFERVTEPIEISKADITALAKEIIQQMISNPDSYNEYLLLKNKINTNE